MDTLNERLSKLGLFLPMAFNYNDKKRLSKTVDDDALLAEYRSIQHSISNVQRANLSINHSNHKNVR